MNYYPFHIGDYLSATRHLSWDEDTAYRRLLDTYYTTEGPLPSDFRAVCRLVLATTDVQREAVRVVLNEFFEAGPGGWVNTRAEAEINAMREKQQKQREKANKRWQKPKEEPGTTPAMPQQQEADAVASKADADAMPPTPTPTPTPTPIEKKEERAQAPLPDWVPVDSWAGYVEMRKKIRKPMTPRAMELVLKKLSTMREEGHSVAEVLDLSTANSWTDVWRPEGKAAKASVPTPKGDIDAYCAAHRNAAWWAEAGFANVYEATSSKCFHHNAAQFRDGKKCEVTA